MREAGSGVTISVTPPGASSAAICASAADGVVEVLEHVREHDRLQAAVGRRVERRGRRDVEPERPRACAREASESSRPSTSSRGRAPRRAAARGRSRPRACARAARDARSRRAGAGRCAAAGLLGQVGVVAHVAVEVVQLGAGGQVGLLDRPAALARVEVAVAADACGSWARRRPRPAPARRPRIAEAQGARSRCRRSFPREAHGRAAATAVTAWISSTVPANAVEVAGAEQEQRLGDGHHRQDEREGAHGAGRAGTGRRGS